MSDKPKWDGEFQQVVGGNPNTYFMNTPAGVWLIHRPALVQKGGRASQIAVVGQMVDGWWINGATWTRTSPWADS